MMQATCRALWILLPAGGALALACCAPASERNAGAAANGLASLANGSHELVEPFTRAELPSIQGNLMHEAHFARDVKCGECHLSSQPMPVDHAHQVCERCHPSQEVAKPVWGNHCLACHYFTVTAQEHAREPQAMMEHLCLNCHPDSDYGGYVYSNCADPGDEMIICDHCHRPHSSEAPAAAEFCAECHTELSDARHPLGSDVKCSMCHRPHRDMPPGQEICTECHGQPADVLIHQIPSHPRDCLACHQPHFTSIEIRDACGDCHENIVYAGSTNQPQAHLDCAVCHELSRFSFKGSWACAACHPFEGAVVDDERIPREHRRCGTCHTPHSWRTTYERNCYRCHERASILEHELPFHPTACAKCHEPHNTADMPASGDCIACHEGGDVMPGFGSNPPEPHLVCANCHPAESLIAGEFTFVGEADSCRLCHAEALAGVSWDEVGAGHATCLACHQPHTMELADTTSSCGVCHGDVSAVALNESHGECLNCHEANHAFKFAGTGSACALCHPGAVAAAPGDLHQECANCHAVDHGFAFKGTGATCLVCHAEVRSQAANELHGDCTNCHAVDHGFAFVGADSSCTLCHPQLEAEHNNPGHADCVNCHAGHGFAAHYESCTVCHADRENHFRGFECRRCHKFGPGGVYKEDPGPAE